MNRRFIGAALGAAVIVAATIPAAAIARDPQRVGQAQRPERVPHAHIDAKLTPGILANTTSNVVLELAGRPVALHQADALAAGKTLSRVQKNAVRSELKATQDKLLRPISRAGGRVLGQYQDALNGIKVRIPLGRLAVLAKLPGVVAVRSVGIHKLDNERGVQYIGAPKAWNDYGYTGQGVKIAIIDSGLDYYHANFGGSGDPDDFANADSTTLADGGFPTVKVAGGYDFVGDDYDASGDDGSPIPEPDPDPLDCIGTSINVGHGSHVGGSAAGFGVLANGSTYAGPYVGTTVNANNWKIGPGVAPKATLYAYRVFGCAGSTDVVVDAINRAVLDGVDVINMSLGSPFGRNDTADAIATNNAVQSGVVVVTSAGNEGPNAYITGSPGTSTGAISTAALDAGYPTYPGARVGLASGNVTAINANAGPLPVTGPIRVLSDGAGGISLGCDDADYAGVVAGDVVVTLRGVCARVDRAIKGQAAGAAAVVMVNNSSSLPPFEGAIAGVTIPFIGTPGTSAAAFLAADGDTVTISASGRIANPDYKHNATFSSGGPRTGDSVLKPDVTAPGVSIISTFSGSGTEGSTLSGTSMASPHTAGVAALVVQAHPTWSPVRVKAAIMNTASIGTGPGGLLGYDPRTNGAGVVKPRLAVDTKAVATTTWGSASVSFGYDPRVTNYSESRTISVTNTSTSTIKYAITSSFVGDTHGATIALSPTSLTVNANQTKTVKVTITLTTAKMRDMPSVEPPPTDTTEVNSISGYVTLQPTNGGPGKYILRVPFLAVPRSLSAVSATSAARYNVVGTTANRNIRVANTGTHDGNADVYQWSLSDGFDGFATSDIRAVGVQSLPGAVGGLEDSDRLIGFSINTWGSWSNASQNEFDVLINTDGDPAAEFAVIGADSGAILAGAFNGEMLAFTIDLGTGDIIDLWSVAAPANGSSVVLYTAASDFGLTDGSPAIRFTVESFSLIDLGDDAVTGTASFDPFNPTFSNGDFEQLDKGDQVTIPASVDLEAFETNPALGWMVVSHDDANGPEQANLLPVGTLPAP